MEKLNLFCEFPIFKFYIENLLIFSHFNYFNEPFKIINFFLNLIYSFICLSLPLNNEIRRKFTVTDR